MSAYIVKYITMDRVASYVAFKRRIDIESKKFKQLVKELWDLNVFSLCERYGKKEKNAYKKHINNYVFTYQQTPTEITDNTPLLMKFFKSFCNFTYQSCEGKADKTKLYKDLDKYEKELGCKIAYSLPEWNKGEWE